MMQSHGYAHFLKILENQDPELVEIIQTEAKLFNAGLIRLKPSSRTEIEFTRKALDVLLASATKEKMQDA